LSLRSIRFDLAARWQLEQEGSVAHYLSLRSIRFDLAARWQLEQEGSVMHRLSPC
jgi:hypothetical protein